MLPFPTMIEFGLPRIRRRPEDEDLLSKWQPGAADALVRGVRSDLNAGALPVMRGDREALLGAKPLASPSMAPSPINPIAAAMANQSSAVMLPAPDAPTAIPKDAPLAPQPRRFKRTFDNGVGGISDRVSYDMIEMPDGSIQYAGTGREADNAPFVFDAGQSNMGQQNADLAAWQAANARSTAMADPKISGAMMLEDLRGKYGVQEAEARRKDVINSKIIEAALFNQQRTYESTGNPAAAKAAFDRTMGIAGSALPPDVAALLGQGGQPAAPGQPSTPGGPPPLNPIAASTIDQDAASILAQPGDYNVGRGETLLKNFGNYKDSAQRRAAIKALLANRPNLDQIGDMILTTAANKFLLQTPRSTANPRDYGAGDTGLPFGIDFKSAIPLPFLGIGVQTGTPEAFIGSRRVPLPQSVRPGTQTGSFLGVNTSAEDLRNAAALNPILADFFAELQAAGYGR